MEGCQARKVRKVGKVGGVGEANELSFKARPCCSSKGLAFISKLRQCLNEILLIFRKIKIRRICQDCKKKDEGIKYALML